MVAVVEAAEEVVDPSASATTVAVRDITHEIATLKEGEHMWMHRPTTKRRTHFLE